LSGAFVAPECLAVQSVDMTSAFTGAFTGDPRTPILIGGGQIAHRAESIEDALDPVALMGAAIRNAATDAGLPNAPDADSLAVVSLLSWRHGDPAYLVAEDLGIKVGETVLTTMGGNSPQTIVNTTATRIQNGEIELAILSGAEAWRTRMRAR